LELRRLNVLRAGGGHDVSDQRTWRRPALRFGGHNHLCRHIAGQASLDEFRGQERSPGDGIVTNVEIDSWVSETAQTIFHPVGTCRMGADPDAVLDNKLRVRGIDGLRVADASSMPDMIGGNTSIPTMMVAERAAGFIRGVL
jgi:choline dehydrogenase